MDINVNIILGIILIAIVTELAVAAIKNIYPDKIKTPIPQLLAILIGIMLCILSGLSIITAFGYTLKYEIVGCIITGIVASTGANSIYDILIQMRDYKDKVAVENHKQSQQYSRYE